MKLIDKTFNHEKRKNEILKTFPEIKQYYGYNSITKYIGIIIVLLQLYISIYINKFSIFTYCIILYCIGATLSQILFLINHEISHNLLFRKQNDNIYFGFIINLPLVFPFSYSFREYHLEHHSHQGLPNKDMDIPSLTEIKFLNQGKIYRFVWLTLQIIMYAIRPNILNPKKINNFKILNSIVQIIFNIILLYFFGYKPFIYLIMSMILAGSFHPTAGHFISEHVFSNSIPYYDTQSYYGPLNLITLNVGYHNEHHDFPNISWYYLPKLNKLAKDYYSQTPDCKSWVDILLNFIISDSFRFIHEHHLPSTT